MGDGDAPEVVLAEFVGLRVRERGVVEIEKVFAEVFGEGFVIGAAVVAQEHGAGGGDEGVGNGVVAGQADAGGSVISAESGVGGGGGGIDVEGADVRAEGGGVFVQGEVAVDAVEDGIEPVLAEEALIGEHGGDGFAPGGTQGEGEELILLEGGDAGRGVELLNDFAVVSGKGAGPAEGVDAVGEGGAEELVEAGDEADAGGKGRQAERMKAEGRGRKFLVLTSDL